MFIKYYKNLLIIICSFAFICCNLNINEVSAEHITQVQSSEPNLVSYCMEFLDQHKKEGCDNEIITYVPSNRSTGSFIYNLDPIGLVLHSIVEPLGGSREFDSLKVREYPIHVGYEFLREKNITFGIPPILYIDEIDPTNNKITCLCMVNKDGNGEFDIPPNRGIRFIIDSGHYGRETSGEKLGSRNFKLKLFYRLDVENPTSPEPIEIINSKIIDGKNFVKTKPVKVLWTPVEDKGSPLSGFNYYTINDHKVTENSYIDESGNLFGKDGQYQVKIKAFDKEGNFSFAESNFTLDTQAQNVASSNINVQTRNRNAVINWPAVNDTIDGVAGSGIAGYQVINSPSNITPMNDITDPPTISEPTKTFPNLTARQKYYLWLRTTDKVGNISDWVCKEYAIKPEVADFQSGQCYAITGKRNGYPLYTFHLKLTKADTVNYIIKRQKYGQPQTLTTFAPIKYVDMERNGFIFEDSVTESGKYQYFVYTDNALSESSEQGKSVVLDVNNIYVTTGIRSANITWDEMGSNLKGYQTILQTLDKPTDYPESPTNNITNPSTDLKCLKTFDNLTAKKAYCIWMRAVDNNGVPTSWFCQKFSPKPEAADFEKDKCKAISGVRDGQLIYGVQFKITEKADAANYLITQEECNNSSTQMSFRITDEDIVKAGYQILEGRGLQKHRTYQFSIVTENALGESSTTSDTLTKTVENITMDPSQIVQVEPRGFEFNPVINFTLGPQTDPEGDELLYRLYVRTPGGVAGQPVATWDPSADGQKVSYTFADKSSNEWQIRCIEKDTQITDRKEIYNPQWNKLEIDSSLKIKVVAKVNGTETNSVTKQQAVSFEILTNSNIQISNYQWHFGDETEIATEPIPTHKYANLTQEGKLYQVTVTVTDQTGMQQQAETKVEVVNTAKGELYTDETWSGSHVVKGVVTIPSGTILTITSGTNVMFEAGGQLIVKGKLIAVDPGNTIQLDAQNGSEGWLGIKFEDTGFGQLEGLAIHNAQRGVVVGGSSYVNLQTVTFDNNNIGMDYYSGTVTATGCNFTSNWESGVKNNSEVSSPRLIQCTFTGNTTHYTDTKGDGSDRINTISGNSGNTIKD